MSDASAHLSADGGNATAVASLPSDVNELLAVLQDDQPFQVVASPSRLLRGKACKALAGVGGQRFDPEEPLPPDLYILEVRLLSRSCPRPPSR